jgi:hypothetical protein
MYDVPDGTIVNLVMECGGTVADRYVVDRTSGSWKSELSVELESERLRAKAADRSARTGSSEAFRRNGITSTESGGARTTEPFQ